MNDYILFKNYDNIVFKVANRKIDDLKYIMSAKNNKKDFKILFVSFFNGEALGTRILFSILNKIGYNTKLLFFKVPFFYNISVSEKVTEEEYKLFEEFILDYKPDLIAFSLVSSVFGLYKKIYNRIRKLGDFKILLGGWQASLNPEECIKYSDFVCIGEGEEAIAELVENLFNNKPTEIIQNFWVKKEDKIIKNSVRPILNNLSKFPIPVFDDDLCCYIENNQLFKQEIYKLNTRYGIIAGRGCPYRCTYCSNVYMAQNVYPGTWNKIRYRNPDHVIQELQEVKKKLPKIERINFYDEVLIPTIDWAEEFFAKYKKQIGLPFYCMFFPGTATEDLIKLLKNSYLAGVWIGVQSGSEKTRKNIFKRHYKNSVVIEQAKLFKKYDISVRYDFIFDNPFETFEDTIESINLMLELPQPYSMNMFSLKYFPNTEITQMALKAGFIDIKDLDDKRLSDRDGYWIKLNNDNTENNFINHVVYYINQMANQSKLNKLEISEIIKNYKKTKNISLIKNKLGL